MSTATHPHDLRWISDRDDRAHRVTACFIALLAFDAAILTNNLATAMAVALVFCAAFTDLTRHKIYNWTTYPAFCFGLGLAAISTALSSAGVSPTVAEFLSHVSIANSLGGALLCGAAMLASYLLSGGGAGDVKIAAALGALLGLHVAIAAIALAYILAAIAVLLRLGTTLLVGSREDRSAIRLDRAIPMGGYFAAGVTLVISGAI